MKSFTGRNSKDVLNHSKFIGTLPPSHTPHTHTHTHTHTQNLFLKQPVISVSTFLFDVIIGF